MGGDREQGQGHAVDTDPMEAVFDVKDKKPDDEQKPLTIQVWGLPWTPQEFLEKAVEAGHPSSFGHFCRPS